MARKAPANHDHAYKLLFSHPRMVRDLLDGFVQQDWLDQLDYDTLEKVNGSYVADDLRGRASDVLWRVRWGDRCLYLYLLLEFQSKVDQYMAVRILTYVGLLYQDLIRANQCDSQGKLPAVLPIVLYNGRLRWSAAQNLEALVQSGPPGLECYRLQAQYVLIDEGRYHVNDLAPLRNLVAALFRLENSRSRTEIDAVLGALVEWLRSPEQRSLRHAFATWIGRVILPALSGEPETSIHDLREMHTMLSDRMQEWREELRRGILEEIRQEIRQEIRLENLQEARQEGEVLLLLRQLRKRFGELPPWVHPRLEQAPPEQLECWGERLLEVDTLEALFEGN